MFDGVAPRVAQHIALWWTTSRPDERPNPERDSAMQFIDALLECEAMSESDAEVWRNRLLVARADRFEPLAGYAEEVRAQAAAIVESVEPGSSSLSDQAMAAQAALHALQFLTAVPVEVVAEWSRRLHGRVSYPPADPAVDEARRRAAAIGQVVPGELERVIAGPFRLSADMTIASVEIYEGATAVRWHYLTRDGRFPAEGGFAGGHVELRDDVGTEYLGRSAGAGRLDRAETREGSVSGRDIFAPTPPAQASALTVSNGEYSCEIALHA